MAYSSSGRKPFERASKISHAQIINNDAVREMLSRCTLPSVEGPEDLERSLIPVSDDRPRHIDKVVAVDGSMAETPIRPGYPSASVTFFTCGPLLFGLRDLDELALAPTIDPADMAKLKRISRHSLALPTANVALDGLDLTGSVRRALHEFLCAPRAGTRLQDGLRWLLFEKFRADGPPRWDVPDCPHGCGQKQMPLHAEDGDDEARCPNCRAPVYLLDALRLHERIDDESGAGAVSSYVLGALETIALVDVIRLILENFGTRHLRATAFVKDGPLAAFGVTAGLKRPLESMCSHLMRAGAGGTSVLNLVGLEKSGPFVEHAQAIADRIPPGNALILSDAYIRRYIKPGSGGGDDVYGRTTYWGNKLIFRAPDGNMYVPSLPAGELRAEPKPEEFSNLYDVLAVVAGLRCSMYDNALLPVALANKLVSLSEFPSTEILRTFATDTVA